MKIFGKEFKFNGFDIWHKGNFTPSKVALSNNYNDLDNKPTSLPANGGNADTVDGYHADSFYKDGSVIMNTNPFGGKHLYINNINNALFVAHKRWAVTGTIYNADGTVHSTLTEEQVSNLFDGNYDSYVVIPLGKYLVINITFNGGYMQGYPYGYVYLSHYYVNISKSAKLRVYCNYEPHGIGWHETDFGNYTSTSNGLILRARQNYYNISQMEIIVYGVDSGDKPTWVSQIEMQLDRPGRQEMPILDKYRSNKLYYNLDMTTNKVVNLGDPTDATDAANKRYIDNIANNKANKTHTHTKSEITDFPTSLPANGGNADTVDGYHANTGTVASTIPVRDSSGNIPGNITGNAATATKLATARTISLTGGVTGSTTFDGGGNVSITTTVADNSHAHTIANVTGLQDALNAKASLASPAFTGTPTAPTAPSGTNNNQIATTAFVQNALSSGGYGDMLKAVYDANNNGIIDKAETADKLTTAKTISLSGGVTGSTSFDGSNNVNISTTVANDSHSHNLSTTVLGNLDASRIVEPAYVTSGITRTAKPIFDVLRADRTAFLPASQIIIEKSTDGGTTWEDAGVSDTNKVRLFTGHRPSIEIPLKNGKKSTDCMIRITITGMKYNVPSGTAETAKYNYWNSSYVIATERYFSPVDGWTWVSSNSDRIYLKVEKATGAEPNTWILEREAYLYGWSGGNYFSLSGSTFGGGTNQPTNYWNWRFTFRTCSTKNTFVDSDLSTTYTNAVQVIYHLKISGQNVWVYSNNYMYHDHLYNWDENQNAIFPAQIKGTQLVSTATTGTAPLQVNSTTLVPNLNAERTNGVKITVGTTAPTSPSINDIWIDIN